MTRFLNRAVKRRVDAVNAIDSLPEAFAHFQVYVLAAVLTVVLRLRLSKPLLGLLRSMPVGHSVPDSAQLEKIVRRSDTVLLLGRPAIRSECLARTCLLYYQMRRAGADVDIRFGVAMTGAEFRSHCWLLVSGEPLYEHFDPRSAFQTLYDLHG